MKPYHFREKLIEEIEKRTRPTIHLDQSETDPDEPIPLLGSETEEYDYEQQLQEAKTNRESQRGTPDSGNTVRRTDAGEPSAEQPCGSVPTMRTPTGTDPPSSLRRAEANGRGASEGRTDAELKPKSHRKRVSENYDRVLPRRSERIPKPRKLFPLLFYLIILMIGSFINETTASLNIISPILWRKSNTPVIVGSNRVVLSINYKSPCIVFASDYFKNYNVLDARNVCERQFEADFIQPMKAFCRQPI